MTPNRADLANSGGWIVPENIVWVAEEGSVRIFNAVTGDFRQLNETGTRIWRLMIEESMSQDRVCEVLGELYNAQTTEHTDLIFADVYAFVDELVDHGMLTTNAGD